MNFKIFDAHMRKFEQSIDTCIPNDTYMIARLDGHGFSKLTQELGFKKPFDIEFHNLMYHVLKTLMLKSNLKILYGYTQSDEISLLFASDEQSFNRKTRKYNSLLAGLASAAASMYLNQLVTFDCRIIPIPDISHVCDYFVWRRADAHRNAMNAYCYWTMRQVDNLTARKSASILRDKDNQWKYQYLAEHDIDFDTTPSWQRLGIGMKFHNVIKVAYNPITATKVECSRRELETFGILPANDTYRDMISEILQENTKDE